MDKPFARPLLGFAAYSGTGKTTLLEKLLPLLRAQGLQVSYIKHSHHKVDIDKPGKDSYRLRQAGASQVLLASAKRWALMQETTEGSDEPRLAELLQQLDPSQCDLVLVEGFKHESIPRIECQRQTLMQQHGRPAFYPDDQHVIALATDSPIQTQRPIPCLDLNQPPEIVQFILRWMGRDTTRKEPMNNDGLISVAEAQQRIRDSLEAISGFERCSLQDAYGRVLAEAVTSPINVPGYVNSAMDGYAINADDLAKQTALTVVGQALAGVPFEGEVKPGQAVRIMTGAMLPTGCDTVVMQEQTMREGDSLQIQGEHRMGANVRQIGEDIAANSPVLPAGRRLQAADLGLLASLGIAEVAVRRRLRVASFSTGDELCSLGQALGPGQIYDSNRYALYGLLREMDVEHHDMGVIRDDPTAIREAFKGAAAIADVVITSGGVSVGDADYVKQILDELGEIGFWRIRMKPGKPLAFGRLGQALFFGLPGNPVSSMATFQQIVKPSLRHLQGEIDTTASSLKLRTVSRLKKRPGRADYQRGILENDAEGELVVRSTGPQGSHILSSMSQANCFIVLPAECGDVEEGAIVEVQPFSML